MNWKIVAAFMAGALLASGIVYFAVRPAPTAQSIADVRPVPEAPPLVAPAPVAAAPPAAAQVAAAPPEPSVEPAITAPPAPEPKPAPRHSRMSQTPIREKPSPMPPVHHERLPVVERNQEVAQATVPAPVPPANPEPPPPTATPSAPAPEPAPPSVTAPPSQSAPPPTTVQPPAASAPAVTANSAPETEGRVPHSVVLEAGTPLVIRMGETVSAAQNQVGDTFFGTLEQQLVIDGFIIGERGARVIGRVSQAVPSGRGGGLSHLAVELVRLSTSDGQRVPIRTDQYVKEGSGSAGSDLAKIGAGAAIGAAIGGLAGGGTGAAIGAGAGAAAGGGAVMLAKGKSVQIPVESRLTFRVKESTTLTEKLD
jgi:hypothetical protein